MRRLMLGVDLVSRDMFEKRGWGLLVCVSLLEGNGMRGAEGVYADFWK